MQRSPEEIELLRLRARLTKRFHKACADYGLITDNDHVLIGLSGGKDSLALVELLGKRAQIHVPHFQVTAVHVRVKERDYHSDLSYLEEFCARAHVPFVVRDTEIGAEEKKDPCFLCSWFRRKALFDAAQELGCNKIALGHHMDDILETLLMNLTFQGAFSTMPPKLVMKKFDMTIIRPMCMVHESDLEEMASVRGFRKQIKNCPYETQSNRTDMKGVLKQLEALNPEARYSLWGSMTNVQEELLPDKLEN